ncbi:PDI1 [Sanghuangporus sanghuang]
MRLSSFAPFAALLAVAGFASAADESSDVIVLTPSNFISVVNKEPLILVEFFAPWCGHCKALAPHYEEAATELKEKGIKLAKVDCVDQADLCQQHDVRGYPTLKVFKNGEPSDYTGPRKADGIVSYMIKQSLPAVAEIKASNHSEFQQADRLVLIAYLSSETQAPAPEFTKTAEKHRDDYLFGFTTDEEVIKEAGVEPPAIVLYRKFDEPRIDFALHAPSATVKEIEAFALENSIPYIDEVSGENYQRYVTSGLPLGYLFVDPTDEKKEEHIAALRPVAQKHKGKINFVWIDAIKFGDHAKALNLPEVKWPGFVLQDLSKQLKYPLSQSEEFTPEKVDVLLEKYLAGDLQPELKSEAIPAEQNEAVYTVVGKTFEDVVFDDSKDVFLEFYAPWCGHCKRLKPTWDSLGERYANVKNRLIIAKMDATENDLPPSVDFRIQGFPTLKFKPAGTREFIDFNGDRSLESLIEFVEENAKNNLEYVPPPAEEVVLEESTEKIDVEGVEHDATQAPLHAETQTQGHDEL